MMSQCFKWFVRKRWMVVLVYVVAAHVHAQVPVINDFSPKVGVAGTTVTITGTNFNAVAANNVVYFGAVRAEVVSASPTSLTVTVPKGATVKPITISTGGMVAYSFQPFIPQGVSGNVTFRPKVDYIVNASPRHIDVGDFNNDGHVDLMICNVNINSLSIMPGDGTGKLLSPLNYNIGSGTHALIADVSGNGFLDLIASNYSSIDNASTSVLLNNGSFNFAPAENYFLSAAPIGIGSGAVFSTAHDFNLDGQPDVAFAIDNIPGSVSILYNAGAGVFNPKVEYPVSNYPYTIAAGDFNKDGYPDLAVANFFTQTLGILMNDGAGGFLSEVTYTSGNGSHDLKLADFNLDGHLDVAIINALSNTVNIFTNDGNGLFPTRSDYPSGTDYQATLDLSDMNGDGVLDIIVGGRSSVYYLLANNSGGFEQPQELVAGNTPYSAVAADFDEDGKPDIVAANFDSNTISVFLTKPTVQNPLPPIDEPEPPAPTPEAPIVVYNALSPNDDGKNDFMFIANIEVLPGTRQNVVTIYNRWGDEVWQGTNYDNTTVLFDGRSKHGDKLPAGTYYYRIKYNNGQSTSGHLSIKR